jgi:two-component system, OmpR family, response regulator
MIRVLIVEDDVGLREPLAALLQQSGYEVVSCATADAAVRALGSETVHLAIIDWVLPGMSGLELVQHLRRMAEPPPILMVTGREALSDRIAGLDAGADDYLVKPFRMPELEARVRALIRRSQLNVPVTLTYGPLTMTPGNPRVDIKGATVELPSSEYILLEALVTNEGRPLSKERIGAQLARDGEHPTDTAIEVCVHRLRRRLAPFGMTIRTLRGFGYLLERPRD